MSKRLSARLSLLSAAAFLILLPVHAARAQAPDGMKRWEAFDFSKRLLTREQLKKVTPENLELMRGIVFRRHGRVFKDWSIKYYLGERAWYKPNPDFTNASLNQTERKNLDLIREYEAAAHKTIEPGDMRWWQRRAIRAANLGQHTGAEWRVLRAEIEAIHGKRFDDQPWLQNYFEERYWYAPRADYDPKTLTKIERDNMTAIDAAQKRQRNVALSPGDMEHFRQTLVTEEMLKGLSLHELRLLRNEVYARRGRQFRAEWLSQHFYSQPWYEPVDGEPELNEAEKKNVETIVAYENRIHEELGAKPLSPKLLEGMFLEDARKLRHEILARRGHVFKDKWLQRYFESLAWYKPDPEFKETALSATEKKNVAALLAYEKKATSVLDAIEG
jgi:hypothetical protein